MRTETFETEGSKFIITLQVPLELDSFYTWVDWNDNNCGDTRKYRFSNSNYPIIKESGFFYKIWPDSSYRLTFSHINKYDCKDVAIGKEIDLDIQEASMRDYAQKDSALFELFSKSRSEINGVKFTIFEFKTDVYPRQKYPSTFISADIFIDSLEMHISYECAGNDCELFLPRMKKSLQTIKIEKLDNRR